MERSGLGVAFLVSGEGSTLEAIAEQVRSGTLAVRLALVVSDRLAAPALARAARYGISTTVVPPEPADPERWSRTVTEQLEAAGAELIVLAGFLSILPRSFVEHWRGRAINLHPSLLPLFGGKGLYGRRVHEAVIASGARESGATVHLVSEEIDRGPVIAQVRLDLRPGETAESLRTRLHPHEVMLLAEVLRRIAAGDIALPLRPAVEAPPRAEG